MLVDTETISGKKFASLFNPEDTVRIETKLLRAFDGKEVLFDVMFKDQYYLVSAVAAYETIGPAEKILVVSQNITYLKKAEEQIHFQTMVLENISDSVIITDLEKNISFWNKASTIIYGFEEHEMIGRNMQLLSAEREDPTRPEIIIPLISKSGYASQVVKRKTSDGRNIWVDTKVTFNYSVENKIVGLICVSKDITEHRAEEHLLKLFQSVIINSHDAVIMTEAVPSEGEVRKIVFVNDAFCAITGFTPEDVIGNTFFMMVGPSTDKNEIARIQFNLTRWQSFTSEISLYRKDNSSFWVDATIMPVSDESGNYTHWVFMQRDITSDRETEEKLLQKNEELTKINLELDRFVYSASHDLRAPLTSVLGLVGLMRKQNFAPEAKIYLDKVQESIQRLDRLIQNIINYSRNSRLSLNSEPINFKEIYETAVGMHRFMDHSSKIKYEFENYANEIYMSDPDRWQIILNNLISNGIKFSRNSVNSFISLKIFEEDGFLIAELTDNGTGISEEHLGNIFGMFYRAANSSEGSGLGLYIVKQTIEILGGTIEVKSKTMEFAQFIIRVPLKRQQQTPELYDTKSNRSAQ